MTSNVIDILLVDDEQRNLDALEAILASPGYRLLIASSADQALRMLLDHDVAAIVLDIRMPGTSGFELAQIIKGTKKFRQIPILFLTAHMMEDQDIIAGYGAGAVDYLTKPVNPQVLRHKLGVFAELFRTSRALAELNATLEARVEQRTAELATSEAALRAAARHKDEFLATLAHELRNPLAPLRMGLDLLLHDKTTSPESSKTVLVMNRQLDHMVRLIDDLLDVARISSGKLELKKEPCDLAVVVQTAIDTCQPFLVQRKQSIDVDAMALPIHADPTRLAQIVGNLIHNASKYTPVGGTVKVELARTDASIVVRVIDSGIGIPDAQLERVFDMFARIEGSGPNTKGLGIGLALSKRLAEMHGGTLTASSPGLGRGSVFTLSLPSVAPHAVVAAPVAAPAPHKKSTSLPSVLVIEDNEDAGDMLLAWLETLHYPVRVARTGTEGLAVIEEMRPDVILCDVGLPDIDGVEVCRRVRALSQGYAPTMIAVTGWGMQEDRDRTKDVGFDHHLVKPVAPDTLVELLQSLSRD